MRTLELSIKQKYLDAIKDGRKVQEFREVRPNNIKKYLQLDQDGYEVEDENANALPIEYDAILFKSKETGDTVLVEVVSAFVESLRNDHGQSIEYEYGGKVWSARNIVFELGRIMGFEENKTSYEKYLENILYSQKKSLSLHSEIIKREVMKIKVNNQEVEAYALIMRKVHALDILSGEKTLEIRAFNTKNESLFTDPEKVKHNEKLRAEGRDDECVAPLRTDVEYVHFYDYRNTWHLDVAIDEIGTAWMLKEDIEFLNKEFNFHDYDNEWQQFVNTPIDDVPMFFYLHIAKVVSHHGLK